MRGRHPTCVERLGTLSGYEVYLALELASIEPVTQASIVIFKQLLLGVHTKTTDFSGTSLLLACRQTPDFQQDRTPQNGTANRP